MIKILHQTVWTTPICDVHEHIISSTTLKQHKRGLIEFIGESYLHDDIISAGADAGLFSQKYEDDQRWKSLSPYIKYVHNTTYYRCLIWALNDLFELNIADITDNNWEELNLTLKNVAKLGAPWYEKVLHSKANITHCLLDMDRTTDTEVGLWESKNLRSLKDNIFEKQFFTRVARTDLLLNVVKDTARNEIEHLYSLKIKDVDDLEELVTRFAKQAQEQQAVAYKSVAAYFRTLSFSMQTREEVALAYKNILSGKSCIEDELKVQNYLIHRILNEATHRDIPFQFHTGMQALNENFIDNSNPIRLNQLFLSYPKVRFIMLHGGYPYSTVAGVIAKKFPNVYLDISWLPQISFTAAKHALDEWLDLVPMNKFTWGGDSRHVENTYSAVMLFRKLIYEILEKKIENNMLDLKTAIDIVHKIMHDNAIKIYNL